MRDVNWYENTVNNWYREVRRRNLTISSPPVILVSVNQIYFTEVIPVCKTSKSEERNLLLRCLMSIDRLFITKIGETAIKSSTDVQTNIIFAFPSHFCTIFWQNFRIYTQTKGLFKYINKFKSYKGDKGTHSYRSRDIKTQ